MAMPVYSAEELEAALKAAGCRKTNETTRTSTIWENPNGKAFQVPFSNDGHYPDWLLIGVCEASGISPIPWGKRPN